MENLKKDIKFMKKIDKNYYTNTPEMVKKNKADKQEAWISRNVMENLKITDLEPLIFSIEQYLEQQEFSSLQENESMNENARNNSWFSFSLFCRRKKKNILPSKDSDSPPEIDESQIKDHIKRLKKIFKDYKM